MAAQCNEDVDSMRRQAKSFQAMISTMLLPPQSPQQQQQLLQTEPHKQCGNDQTDTASAADASVDEPCKLGLESDQLNATASSAGSEILTPPLSTHNIESLLASIQV